MAKRRAAIFLDRDGVLIEDRNLLLSAAEIRILEGVPAALCRFQQAGYCLVVVSNQPVVARGLISEAQLQQIHAVLADLLLKAGAPPLDAVYYCPHHPHATLPEYRLACDCRKPRPGLLLQAARELHLDLPGSFLLGDRLTDVIAGAAAGCRTVLVRSPATAALPIVTADPIDPAIQPDHVCLDLPSAADWILGNR